MATVTFKNFASPTALSGTAAAIYTCPANNVARIDTCKVHNTGATSRVVTVYFVPSGGSVSTSTQVEEITVAADTTVDVASMLSEILEAGDAIQMKQDTGTDVNAWASGREIA